MKSLARLMLCVLTLASIAAPVWAQRRANRRGSPAYDASAEVTVSGTVEEVKRIQSGARSAGVHVILKTDKETLDVRLGPSTFLERKDFAISKGDQLEIVGSKVKLGNASVILAREVKKGDRTLTLRDKSGIPAWSRRPS